MDNIRKHMNNKISLSNIKDNENFNKAIAVRNGDMRENIIKLFSFFLFFMFVGYNIDNYKDSISIFTTSDASMIDRIRFYSVHFDEIKESFFNCWFTIHISGIISVCGIYIWRKVIYGKSLLESHMRLFILPFLTFFLFLFFYFSSPISSLLFELFYFSVIWGFLAYQFFTFLFNILCFYPLTFLNEAFVDKKAEKEKKENINQKYKESLNDIFNNPDDMLLLYDKKDKIVLEFKKKDVVKKEIEYILSSYKRERMEQYSERDALIKSFDNNLEIENS